MKVALDAVALYCWMCSIQILSAGSSVASVPQLRQDGVHTLSLRRSAR